MYISELEANCCQKAEEKSQNLYCHIYVNVCFFPTFEHPELHETRFVWPIFVECASVFSPVFRVDLFCSGKVDGEAVVTMQLNLTIHANNYTVLNFKRRKMCYKSKCPNNSYLARLWGSEMEKALIQPWKPRTVVQPKLCVHSDCSHSKYVTAWQHSPASKMDSCFEERLCDEIQVTGVTETARRCQNPGPLSSILVRRSLGISRS